MITDEIIKKYFIKFENDDIEQVRLLYYKYARRTRSISCSDIVSSCNSCVFNRKNNKKANLWLCGDEMCRIFTNNESASLSIVLNKMIDYLDNRRFTVDL